MNAQDIIRAVKQALIEDLDGLDPQTGDITAALIPVSNTSKATVITREDCIFCGKAWV